MLNSLPLSYMPPPHIAALREKVRRRSFLVGQQTKLKIKIRSTLTYEGVKPPGEYGLFTRKGREWLRGLGLEPVDSYLRMMEPLRTEIRLLSLELRHIAADDEDVRLLMTIPGVGYYIALLVKAEVGDISRNLSRNQWGMGIQVNLPLIDNGQRRGEIRQAEIALEQSRLTQDIRRQQVIQDIRNAVRNLNDAERQISLREAALEVANRTYEVEQSRFELGLAQSQDLLDAQAELTQARIDNLDSIISYQRQLKNLRLATMAELKQLGVVSVE